MTRPTCADCGAKLLLDAPTCPGCKRPNPHRRAGTALTAKVFAQTFPKLTGAIVVGLGIVVIMNLAPSAPANPSGASAASAVVPPPFPALPPEEEAVGKVDVTGLKWHRGGFGTVMVASIAVRNRYSRAVKDVEVTCTHTAPSGTVLGRSSKTIYEVVKAGQTRRFPEVNMGFLHEQAVTSKCQVTRVAVP